MVEIIEYIMAKTRSFFYVVDRLTPEKGKMIKKALEMVPDVAAVNVGLSHGVVEVQAARDPEAQIKMACEIVGSSYRMRVQRKHL